MGYWLCAIGSKKLSDAAEELLLKPSSPRSDPAAGIPITSGRYF
jgi:hypothetical protein